MEFVLSTELILFLYTKLWVHFFYLITFFAFWNRVVQLFAISHIFKSLIFTRQFIQFGRKQMIGSRASSFIYVW